MTLLARFLGVFLVAANVQAATVTNQATCPS